MNTVRLRFLFVLLVIPALAFAAPADNPDAVVGRWLSSKKKNQVLIYKQGDRYFGKLVWMLEPTDVSTSKPKLDKLNPQVQLRHRPLLNLPIMTNLLYKGNNVWGDGQIYNPEDGKTYGCELTLRDANTMEVHGYMMGMRFLGKTITWTRVP
ncbi:uncharacterized protein (DUF2147 family) [Spirosoma lacussanchae]|uniref:DUF2147 domain-containing protein n=1 Tax=Spirosoma lacussanchae TaxID=1884249 RepID=UPI00110827B6|nr:DUF2147 domain-containing protein [Spirosoma lacussanchae]